ncbi:MAG: ABC transporter ATP-binding protein [Anaerolineales bacterium]|jgi:ABC-type lipoprotein export system ATPase subunit|nr:ABC transporter ATP-binding protein [Anaerolineales bacterium]
MSTTPSLIVETKDLTRVYGDGEEIRALDGVNMKIEAGELVTVMGPSGSGKSTLLNMVGALDRPTSGQVFVNGQDLAKIRDKDRFRAKTVGFMFQLHNLLPTLNARENVEVPMMGHVGSRARRKRAEELLELVGLPDRMDHLPSQLSGGQRQRVAVARSLANNPPLVLADEPTGSLDTSAGQELLKLLHDLNESQGTTFLVVTHDPAVARQTRRVLVMADGRIVREDVIGSPQEEDLKMWRHSGLGRRIVAGETSTLENLGLTTDQQEALQELLSSTDGGQG